MCASVCVNCLKQAVHLRAGVATSVAEEKDVASAAGVGMSIRGAWFPTLLPADDNSVVSTWVDAPAALRCSAHRQGHRVLADTGVLPPALFAGLQVCTQGAVSHCVFARVCLQVRLLNEFVMKLPDVELADHCKLHATLLVVTLASEHADGATQACPCAARHKRAE